MNIWYVNPYAGGPGVGRYWRSYHLANAWMSQGHKVEIVSPSYHHLMDAGSRKVGRESVEGVSYNFIPSIKYVGNGIGRFLSMIYFGFSLFFFLIWFGFKNKPDLILYSSAHPFGYPAAFLCAKIFRSKIHFEVRDIWPLSLIEVAGFKKTHPVVILLSLIEKFAYFSADSVISLLPGAKEHMVSRGMLPSKFKYVPNGFSLSDLSVVKEVQDSDLLTDLEKFRSNGDFIFFYAGALGEPNAMHKFVDALSFFEVPEGTSAKFIVVGKGEQGSELKARCKDLGYDFVIFYPQVDKAVVQAALERVDACFFVMHDLPIYRFGISLNKLYDYMAAAVPVVASYRAFNDPVKQSGCGMSVVPNRPDLLGCVFREVMLLEKNNLKDMGEKGRAFLEDNFEYSSLARLILE